MKKIKAIETSYNGYKFRSRLEARWAVFFDSMNIQYEYELEGYELEDGTRYLPDFYLPEFDVYAEVKANRPEAEKDIERIEKIVAANGAIKSILILSTYNNPDKLKNQLLLIPMLTKKNKVIPAWGVFCEVSEMKFFCYTHKGNRWREACDLKLQMVDRAQEFADFRCNSLEFEEVLIDSYKIAKKHAERQAVNRDLLVIAWCMLHIATRYTFFLPDYDSTILVNSLIKARQARFEYGETPTT